VDAVERLAEVAHDEGKPARAVLVPTWNFDDPERRVRADAVLAELMGRLRPDQVILQSMDLSRIRNVWLPMMDLRAGNGLD